MNVISALTSPMTFITQLTFQTRNLIITYIYTPFRFLYVYVDF